MTRTRSSVSRFALSLACALAAVGAAGAQTVLLELEGASDRDFYGWSFDAADLNGDGRTDLIVGAAWHDGAIPQQGLVEARSLPDGALLWRRVGGADGAVLGSLVSVVGDIDGDGTPDVLLGAPGFELPGGFTREGRALIVPGADGTTLRTHDGPSFQEEFGSRGGAVGDVDGDGVGDYGIGAFWNWDPIFPGPPDPAGTTLFSGADGAPLRLPAINQGRDLQPAGDVDGDGTADWLLTRLALQWEQPEALLRSGLNGAPLDSEALPDGGLVAVGAALDVSGDGLPEYAFAWGPSDGQQLIELRGAGGLHAGLVLSSQEVAEHGFARALDGRADLNGDGVADLLVGLPSSPAGGVAAGEVRLLSGVDLSELARLTGENELGELGHGVRALGDVDGDGVADWAVSEPSHTASAPGRPGRVLVVSGGALGWVDLGQGLAGTRPPPQLTGSGALLPGTVAELALSGALQGAPAHVVAGFSALDAVFKGGVMGPAPDLILSGLFTDGSGALALATTWPELPPATSVWFQVWVEDAGGPAGFSASNTVSATNAP